jgi:Fic family protein
MAVGHYQFEAIHPFVDGNGRTGRILNLLFLIQEGLLDLPILYLSSAIIKKKGDYYRLLLRVTTRQAWEEWVLFMIRAVEDTARWTTSRIQAIRQLIRDTAARVRDKAYGAYSRELVELLFVQPYCRIANVVEAGIAKRQTASTYLHKLESIGVLQAVKSGKETLFINKRFMRVLTSELAAPASVRLPTP